MIQPELVHPVTSRRGVLGTGAPPPQEGNANPGEILARSVQGQITSRLVLLSMNKFTIIYPNGIKRHVNRLERDLLLSSLTQIAPREYAAPSLQTEIEQMNAPKFLPGKFTIEYGDRRIIERLESVGAMTARLFRQGILAT